MKLNPDCIREVLLEIEKSWELRTDSSGNISMGKLNYNQICSALPDYDKKDIFYSLYNMKQAGYIDLSVTFADNGIVYRCTVNHMTYEGHEFLDKIRDSKHWSAVKNGLNAVRNYSLDAINAIASGVTTAAIAAYLEKTPLL